MEDIRKFHGWVAPGGLLGGFMVNYALELVEKKDLPLEVLNQTILEAGREALPADPAFITN